MTVSVLQLRFCIVHIPTHLGMPYMADKAQKIGINTLPEYCGKGYASAVSGIPKMATRARY